jgi:hypothetical protein
MDGCMTIQEFGYKHIK